MVFPPPPPGKGSINFTKTETELALDVLKVLALLFLSLGAQTILTIYGNRRKYRLRYKIRFYLWLSYLMASPLVTLVLGKISGLSESVYDALEYSKQETPTEIGRREFYIGWWAPLLLVQNCSPNIISYSVEDNKLKSREVVGLTSQLAIALWILYESWNPKACFLIPLLLMYAVGIIKVEERIRALKSLSNSENAVITTFANNDTQKVVIPVESISSSSNLVSGTYSHVLSLLVKAYQRFDRLKPFLENWLGHPSSTYLPSMSMDDYLPKDVFTVTEFELSFMYDFLYTKAPVNYSKKSFWGRTICILLLAFALSLMVICPKKNLLYIMISVVFAAGTFVLEIYEIKQLLYSDWAILYMMKRNRSRFMRRLLRIVAPTILSKKHRWSNHMDQFNLLSYCLYEKPTKLGWLMSRFVKVKGYHREYKKHCVKKDIQVSEELKTLIVEQIHEGRAQRGGQPFSKSGEWALERCNCLQDLEWSIQIDFGIDAMKQTNFGKAIITWHIATIVCYYLDDSQSQGTINHSKCEMSKVLANYMMYLLAMHPDMLSIVTGDILFRGTCAQVGEFFKTKQSKDEATLCRILVELVDENYQQGIPKNNVFTSEWNVLLHVQRLVGILRGREDRWRIISSVWVEILCYGATICPWTLHAEQLRRGGELLTHVWLLLKHETDEVNVRFS